MHKNSIIKLISVVLLIAICLSFTSCGISIGSSKNNDVSNMTDADRINNSELLYPKTNKDFRYNVYTYYIEITEYIGDGGRVVVPAKLDDLPVLCIGPNAFSENDKITEVEISKGIVKIFENAFKDSINIQSIKLPSSMIRLCDNAFDGCKSLNQIIIPANVVDIPQNCFNNCISLNSVTIEESDNQIVINSYAFANCKNLKNVWIPSNIITIDDSAFNESMEFLTIYGYPRSPAAIYCANNLIDFTVLDKNKFSEIVKKTKDIETPIQTIKTKISEINKQYMSDKKYITDDNLIDYRDTITNLANALKEQNVIINYTYNNLTFVFQTQEFGDYTYKIPYKDANTIQAENSKTK